MFNKLGTGSYEEEEKKKVPDPQEEKKPVNEVLKIVEIADSLQKKDEEEGPAIEPVTPLDQQRTPFEPKET